MKRALASLVAAFAWLVVGAAMAQPVTEPPHSDPPPVSSAAPAAPEAPKEEAPRPNESEPRTEPDPRRDEPADEEPRHTKRLPRDLEPVEAPPPRDDKRSLIPGFVLAGVAAVGIAVGTAALVVSSKHASDAKDEAKAIKKGGGNCKPMVAGFEARCADVTDAASGHNTWQKVGRGAMAVGVATGAVALVYFLWPDKRPSSNVAVRVMPSVGLGEKGIDEAGGKLEVRF